MDSICSGAGYGGAQSNHAGNQPGCQGSRALFPSVSPPLCRTDQAKGDHTEPEIDDEAKIYLEEPVPGRERQGWHKDVIRCIAQQHRQERLQEIRAH